MKRFLEGRRRGEGVDSAAHQRRADKGIMSKSVEKEKARDVEEQPET